MTTENKWALVTGAAKGIGKAIARSLADAGVNVIIADSDKDSGLQTLKELSIETDTFYFIHSDLSIPDSVNQLFREINSISGGVDILVNNAGFGIQKDPFKLTVEEWDSVLNTNLRGAFLCTCAAASVMKQRGGGSVVNIASTRYLMSEPGWEAYAASKGGLVALTHAMAASLSDHNIRVNCISPGWIETGDYSKLREQDHRQHFAGRVGKPEDIAAACLFLVQNDFINGENLVIDGGMTKKMIYEP